MEVALNMEKFRVMGSRLRPIKKNPLKVINLQGILISVAVRTGLEPVTPCVTGMYSNQLN